MGQNRTRRTRFLIFLSCLIGFLFLVTATSTASTPKQIILPLNDHDITLVGVSNHVFNVNLNPDWLISSANLSLKLRFSQLISWGNSSISISLNGVPLKSFRLDTYTSSEQQINLPLHLLNPFNTIEISTNLRRTDNACADRHDRNLWVVIEPSASLELNFRQKDGAIRLFPLPLIDIFMPQPFQEAIIVIPDQPSEATIKALLQFIAHLGFQGLPEVKLPIKRASEVTNAEKSGNLLFIGLIAEFESTWLLPLDSDINRLTTNSKEGLIALHKFDNNNWFYIVASEPHGLNKTIRYLEHDLLRHQFLGKEVFLTDMTLPPKIRKPQPYFQRGKVSFQNLGYGTFSLEGKNPTPKNIFVALPLHYQINGPVKVNLDMRYAQTFDNNKSYLTLKVNDIPLQTILLNPQHHQRNRNTLNIPQNLISPWGFNLQLNYYAKLEDDDCHQEFHNLYWITFHQQSSIDISYQKREELYFSQFVDRTIRYNTEELLFVLSEDFHAHDLNLIAYLLLSTSQKPYDLERINVLLINEEQLQHDQAYLDFLEEALASSHYIIGLNPLIMRQIPLLFTTTQFDFTAQSFLTVSDNSLIDDFLASSLILSYTKSPFNPKFTGLAITYNPFFSFTTPQAQALSFRNIPPQVKGDTAFIAYDGTIIDFYLHSTPLDIVFESIPTPVLYASPIFIIVFFTTLTLILIAFFLFRNHYLYRKRKGASS